MSPGRIGTFNGYYPSQKFVYLKPKKFIYPKPGIWTEKVKPIICKKGYHYLRLHDLLFWAEQYHKRESILWIVEVKSEFYYINKGVTSSMKLVHRVKSWRQFIKNPSFMDKDAYLTLAQKEFCNELNRFNVAI